MPSWPRLFPQFVSGSATLAGRPPLLIAQDRIAHACCQQIRQPGFSRLRYPHNDGTHYTIEPGESKTGLVGRFNIPAWLFADHPAPDPGKRPGHGMATIVPYSCIACHTTCTMSLARMRIRFLRAASASVRSHCWQAEITTWAPVSWA